MSYKISMLFLIFAVSIEAFFNEKDSSMTYFNEFDDIIVQMKSFRKELETLDQNLLENNTKKQKNCPTITCLDHQKEVAIIINNIPLTFEKKDIIVDATVSYNKDGRANNIHLTSGDYKIDIHCNEDAQYIGVNMFCQSSIKKEDKDAKLSQTIQYSSRTVQPITGNVNIEESVITADHPKNILTITIPKTADKVHHKKIEVTKVN